MATNYNLNSASQADAYTVGHLASGTGIKTLSALVELKGKTTSDSFTLFKIPAGSAVVASSINVIENAGETATINVGYQTGTTTVGATFISGANVSQAAGTAIAGAGTDMIEGANIQQAFSTNLTTSASYIGAVVASGSTFAAGKFVVNCAVLFG